MICNLGDPMSLRHPVCQTCPYSWLWKYIHIYMHIYLHTYTYTYIYIYIHMYTYIYVYTFLPSKKVLKSMRSWSLHWWPPLRWLPSKKRCCSALQCTLVHDVTLPNVRHDSSKCATWLIQMCDTSATWLIQMCCFLYMTRLIQRPVALLYMTWLFQMCDMSATWLIHRHVARTLVYHMTHPNVRHDAFKCATWVRHDSFKCATWLI